MAQYDIQLVTTVTLPDMTLGLFHTRLFTVVSLYELQRHKKNRKKKNSFDSQLVHIHERLAEKT